MTSKLTRERLQEIAEDGFLKHRERKELARMALSAMDSEPVALQPELAKVIYHFRDWNEGFPVERFKADYVISWMLANYPPAQPAPVVMDDTKLRELFDSWFASDCSFDLSPEASEADNIAWRESYWYVWQRCRAAMLQELQKSAGDEVICRSNENVQVLNTIKATPTLGSFPKTGEVQNTNPPENPGCWCRTCRPVVLNDMRFVVCPDCGNKRCPRANDHRNACTGSNEPGQEGSVFPDTPREVKGE